MCGCNKNNRSTIRGTAPIGPRTITNNARRVNLDSGNDVSAQSTSNTNLPNKDKREADRRRREIIRSKLGR